MSSHWLMSHSRDRIFTPYSTALCVRTHFAYPQIVSRTFASTVGRQHRVRTTPIPAKAAQTHQDDDNAGGTAEAGAGQVNGGVREHSRLEEYARGG
jgi:hypothetical protein